MLADDILTLPPPPADARVPYGSDPNQFGELRVPKTGARFPVVMNIHGGYWRAKYDLKHAGHFCAALTARGLATWNLEYRRVGNVGGGWPGTFEDVRSGYRQVSQIAGRYNLDLAKMVVMGHSAGGQLALCLTGHEASVKRVISLAGVVDLQQAWELHLSDNAVVDFLGGEPRSVPEHYREADPMQLKISQATQWLIHGAADDTVPPFLSRNYTEQKKKHNENVHYLEISTAGHFDLIDPRSPAWAKVEGTLLHLLEL
ncbi:MAG TPA: alpha/beta hydrolase [Terriglobales bacterium]|nr:alpha/beta hydrolase [Terriglobales bacterium]